MTGTIIVERCVCCEIPAKTTRKRGRADAEKTSEKRRKLDSLPDEPSLEESDDSRTSTYVCPASPEYRRQLDWFDEVLLTKITVATQTDGDLFIVL